MNRIRPIDRDREEKIATGVKAVAWLAVIGMLVAIADPTLLDGSPRNVAAPIVTSAAPAPADSTTPYFPSQFPAPKGEADGPVDTF